jgi:hypothetical protein
MWLEKEPLLLKVMRDLSLGLNVYAVQLKN